MLITLYAAVSQNSVIGCRGELPWRLSSDLKRFRSYTMGKPVIMGRKTWESLPNPLSGRLNIVVSKNPYYVAEGAHVVYSPEQALEGAENYFKNKECEPEAVIIGGSFMFNAFMPLAHALHITHVLVDIEGDSFFPSIDCNEWKTVSSVDYPAGVKDDYPTRYAIYERIS